MPADFALRIGVRARRSSSCGERGVCSGCERGASASVAVQGEAVDHDGVAEEVERLAVVGAAEPEGVVEVAVDGFGVVAARVEAREVGVGWCDGPEVFGAVQFPRGVLFGVVESDGDDPVAVVVGELVVVVPTIFSGRHCCIGAGRR